MFTKRYSQKCFTKLDSQKVFTKIVYKIRKEIHKNETHKNFLQR